MKTITAIIIIILLASCSMKYEINDTVCLLGVKGKVVERDYVNNTYKIMTADSLGHITESLVFESVVEQCE